LTTGPEAAPTRSRTFSIVCLSSQDWDEALPTNRQQIMARAAQRGHRVLFVETGGFLGKHLAALLRGPGRLSLARRLLAVERVAPGVDARKSLNVLPWGQRFDLSRRVNAAATFLVLRVLARRRPRPLLLWVYDPAAVPLDRPVPWPMVYDVVDDYPEQAGGGARGALVAAADRSVASSARLVFATTPMLVERQSARNEHTHLVPNGADFTHFSTAADAAAASPDVAELRHPVIGFTGNLHAMKVDFDLLRRLARARPNWTFLLVGPAQKDVEAPLAELVAEPNVVWLGPRAFAELPRYVAAFDVGLIPYLTNAYTRNCSPLKLYEYLAAGKPVVATGLPSLEGMEPDVVVAEGGVAPVVAALDAALAATGEAEVARRMATAAENTWDGRAERLLSLVDAEIGPA
jgi:glycosyltransferase involved in cell wall biosynthesis